MSARYVMIGGFLGAGKTTAMLRLARHLTRRGLRVGLITNDQSVGLVDTALVGSEGFPVQEITGGCFCCRFSSLVEAAERLTAEARPDVFLAEPVGSCTDLRASVSYPLRRIYGDAYSIAPLSVLVDPIRARRVLDLAPGRSFSRKVLYVYGKQLEEAECLVINKCDLLADGERLTLRRALADRYPGAELFEVSARTGDGLDAWFERLGAGDPTDRPAPDLDYGLYGEGEALLGWLNGTARVAARDLDGNCLLLDLAGRIRDHLAAAGVEIAHLKMTLTPGEDEPDLAVVNLVRSDASPELSHALADRLDVGELIVNLRAEGDPELLRAAVAEALAACEAADAGLVFDVTHLERFRLPQPVPTHRFAVL